MLWRLTPRDRVTLDLWENIAGGLYRAETLPVRYGGGRCAALVYVARPRPEGRPKPGYMELVVAAARALELPPDYIASLAALAAEAAERRRRIAAWRNSRERDPPRRRSAAGCRASATAPGPK